MLGIYRRVSWDNDIAGMSWGGYMRKMIILEMLDTKLEKQLSCNTVRMQCFYYNTTNLLLYYEVY